MESNTFPFHWQKIKKTTNIDRVRPNKGIELYKHIDELGYIKNRNVIEKHLTTFGRANCPHQVMFYGALETALMDKPRFTAIAETSHLFRNKGKNCLEGEHYTVSRWETNKEFLVVEIVFSEYALRNNPEVAQSFENQKKFLKSHNLNNIDLDFQLEFIKFISEEFSKKVSNDDDYKISAAYTNLALLHPDVNGISYPSVQTEYAGINVVLTPEAVNKFLKPIICSTLIVYKKDLKSLIVNGEHFCKTIEPNQEIEWKKRNNPILTDKERIMAHLEN